MHFFPHWSHPPYIQNGITTQKDLTISLQINNVKIYDYFTKELVAEVKKGNWDNKKTDFTAQNTLDNVIFYSPLKKGNIYTLAWKRSECDWESLFTPNHIYIMTYVPKGLELFFVLAPEKYRRRR